MKFAEKREEKLFGMARKYFKLHKPDNLHDIDHIERVIFWVKLLSEKEGADSSITIPAAILHDIAIPEYGDKVHARKGSAMCKSFLKECGYSENEIKKVSETILMHSTDDPNPQKTKEGRVLFDADKLDVTGPVSLHRWFFSYANKGFLHEEAVKKILEHLQGWKKKYGDPPFFTKTGKRIGKNRLKYVESICREILKDAEKLAL